MFHGDDDFAGERVGGRVFSGFELYVVGEGGGGESVPYFVGGCGSFGGVEAVPDFLAVEGDGDFDEACGVGIQGEC